MLYYFFRYLGEFGISGAHMWSYISFRAILTLVLSLIISAWFGEWFIKYMRRRHISEEQRDASIDPYGVEKKGVPAMGGVIIIVATLIPVLLFGRLRNIYLILMVGTTLWLGLLGFWDDYTKMTSSKDGIRPIYKLIGQAILGLVVGLTLWLSPDAVVHENVTVERQNGVEMVTHTSEPVKSTVTTIPFFKDNNLRYSDVFLWLGKYRTAAGWILFVLVTTFVVMAVSNGANLNDGMDGMCSGNAAIMCLALAILAYVSSHIQFASYLNIMYVPGSEELVVFLMAFVGALIGFLWYNAYPAQIFMGDTGSLAIGGIIAVTAIIIHKELLLPLICFIFFIESVSVILQTNYARYGNKRGLKLRFFKRAPIHDTFRVKPGQLPPDFKVLLNWPRGCWLESKITTRFWIITIMMCALAIVTLKIR
ncbi:MAG: phospho-N-acetylmuramoyl-pentapeptide-transferase [Bacteroidaceae bacterium]|nr:phospho-N-acetylmuramoyl-pentapeptide-transferase [Bacteroidaceae bacterium]MBR1800533.1 phospho-N-acetylmuramoyl-pentapeptide-transferase [Bacteroidaceae bacterium]